MVQKNTTAFIQAQLSINQEFKTKVGLPMLRVHGKYIYKKVQQVDGMINVNSQDIKLKEGKNTTPPCME